MDSELQQEDSESLTEEQKKAILEDYAAAMRGEVVDAYEALAEDPSYSRVLIRFFLFSC